jgi:hypothetical protein
VITIEEKVIKGACISYGGIDKEDGKIEAGKPARKGPLEKLVVLQVVKKFSTLNGTLNFITVFTKARQISPS